MEYRKEDEFTIFRYLKIGIIPKYFWIILFVELNLDNMYNLTTYVKIT